MPTQSYSHHTVRAALATVRVLATVRALATATALMMTRSLAN
jgi:hypothetical protein